MTRNAGTDFKLVDTGGWEADEGIESAIASGTVAVTLPML